MQSSSLVHRLCETVQIGMIIIFTVVQTVIFFANAFDNLF